MPGPWRTDRVEYLREIMDCFSDGKTETVVGMMPAQSAKSEVILNVIGYYTENDPSPILLSLETEKKAKNFSKTRIQTMYEEAPCFHGLVADERARDSSNTTLYKDFKDGYLVIIGSHSPAEASSYPIRIALSDEIDRYPDDLKGEGDILSIIGERTNTFYNRKRGLFSTPTVKNISKIETAYNGSDMRLYYVPCPKCDHFQTLKWANVEPKDDPEKAMYLCESCEKPLRNEEFKKTIKLGKWKARKKFRGIAGFWLSALYSPWVSLRDLVAKYIKAKNEGIEGLKTFINLSLCETFEENYEEIDSSYLSSRLENYKDIIPADAAILTCSIDVQGNRLEYLVVAWGLYNECWVIESGVFVGSPNRHEVWNSLDFYLNKTWNHENGAQLKLSVTVIDHGFLTQEVENFVQPRQSRNIFAIKGKGGPNVAYLSTPSLRKIGLSQVSPIIIGTDTVKDSLFARLKIEKTGAGYIHFNESCDKDFFLQLTAEVKSTKKSKGRIVGTYYRKIRARNEILDLMVYNMGAFAVLRMTDDAMAKYLQSLGSLTTDIGGNTPKQRFKYHKRNRPFEG